MRDRIIRFHVRLFNSDPDYPKAYGAPYYPKIGTQTSGVYTLFTTMGQVFTATYGSPPAPPQPFIGYYAPEARLMLMLGQTEGVAGAKAGLDYLMGYRDTYGGSVLDDVKKRSGWAIAMSSTGLASPTNLRKSR